MWSLWFCWIVCTFDERKGVVVCDGVLVIVVRISAIEGYGLLAVLRTFI